MLKTPIQSIGQKRRAGETHFEADSTKFDPYKQQRQEGMLSISDEKRMECSSKKGLGTLNPENYISLS